ncbi:MAG: replication-associated recombination protein A [Thiotrichales bacterium]
MESEATTKGAGSPFRPLADRLRPQSIDDIFGQEHLLSPGKPLYQSLQEGHIHSMVFWGPPGTGKTTLARLVAHHAQAHFQALSAVLSGVKDIRAAVEQARQSLEQTGVPTVLFVDEVHRFNKAQQDAFLPHIEEGVLTFVGATTENPSFELNNALLSRVRVYVLKSIATDALVEIARRALPDLELQNKAPIAFAGEQLRMLAEFADGDARRMLNLLELGVEMADLVDGKLKLTEAALSALTAGGARRFDQQGEYFYDLISAMHKSVRGSNPDASLYWFCRMLDGGVDPRYLARRLLRIASEDIGNADPRALGLCVDAAETYERLGSPEGDLALAQAVVYLAAAPKSNAVYKAFNQAMASVKRTGSLEVPLHLRNAPTKLMKSLDYGKGYRYAHDEAQGYAAGEQYLPEGIEHERFYAPVDRGLEIKIREKMERLRALDEAAKKS